MKAWILRSIFAVFCALVWSVVLESKVYAEAATITAAEFQKELPEALKRVEEFEYIREQASKFGVRVWLFGGSAASFGNYLRWSMLGRKGDERYSKKPFDFDFSDVFRGNQDLDLVIDGDEKAAEILEEIIAKKFPYFTGGRSTFEVRLLTKDRGSKERLLDNPDFQENQDSDSASTALIELTDPQNAEGRVVDVRDLRNKENPIFLQDLLSEKIRLYASDKHYESKRFVEGKNPKIIEVIRYFTKVFQFGYEVGPEDLKKIRQTVADFQPKALEEGSYVYKWIQKNGIKLYENSSDVLRATEMMEEVGLRKKLREIKGNKDEVGSLAWWMNKEPLKAKKVSGGDPTAATAESLGIDYITHDTRSLTAWECMTRSPLGDVNAFISRQDQVGEAAVYGEGLYCMPGKVGAWGTQLPVQLKLKPEARLGWDFVLVDPKHPQTSAIILLNKAAVTVEPQKSIEPMEYFQLLASGVLQLEDISNPLQRRIHRKYMLMDERGRREIDAFVRKKVLRKSKVSATHVALFKEWTELPPPFLLKTHLSPLEYFKVATDFEKQGHKVGELPNSFRTIMHRSYLANGGEERRQITCLMMDFVGAGLGRFTERDYDDSAWKGTEFRVRVPALIKEWLGLPVLPVLSPLDFWKVWARVNQESWHNGMTFGDKKSQTLPQDLASYYKSGANLLFPIWYLFRTDTILEEKAAVVGAIVDYYFSGVSAADLGELKRQLVTELESFTKITDVQSLVQANSLQVFLARSVFSNPVWRKESIMNAFFLRAEPDVFFDFVFKYSNEVNPEFVEKWLDAMLETQGFAPASFFSQLSNLRIRQHPRLKAWIKKWLHNRGWKAEYSVISLTLALSNQSEAWTKTEVGAGLMDVLAESFRNKWAATFLFAAVLNRNWRKHPAFEQWMTTAIGSIGYSDGLLNEVTAERLLRAWIENNVETDFLQEWAPRIKAVAEKQGWPCGPALKKLARGERFRSLILKIRATVH